MKHVHKRNTKELHSHYHRILNFRHTIFTFLLISLSFICARQLFAGEPENITVSNVSRDRFTVSWRTQVAEKAEVRYGTASSFDKTSYDVRGEAFEGPTHYVTVTGLNADAAYYYDILSGDILDDNDGRHYKIATGPVLSPEAGSDIVYGRVFLEDGATPCEGAIVYVKLEDNDGLGSSGDSEVCSSLTDKNGYWHFDLKNMRTSSLNSYFNYSEEEDGLSVEAVAPAGGGAFVIVDTAGARPAPNLIIVK